MKPPSVKDSTLSSISHLEFVNDTGIKSSFTVIYYIFHLEQPFSKQTLIDPSSIPIHLPGFFKLLDNNE